MGCTQMKTLVKRSTFSFVWLFSLITLLAVRMRLLPELRIGSLSCLSSQCFPPQTQAIWKGERKEVKHKREEGCGGMKGRTMEREVTGQGHGLGQWWLQSQGAAQRGGLMAGDERTPGRYYQGEWQKVGREEGQNQQRQMGKIQGR